MNLSKEQFDKLVSLYEFSSDSRGHISRSYLKDRYKDRVVLKCVDNDRGFSKLYGPNSVEGVTVNNHLELMEWFESLQETERDYQELETIEWLESL